ncbi:uncharacterized protein LOC129944268 [Eupeodes corollae]|uniref:uncharacterized protein LOC129944268 n=1 Tax=Eupeodes corollae TaxID=290404 RepID=UPI0024926516|nr:uncharacterized protein LOC129944268 [Eupeodes corollae]
MTSLQLRGHAKGAITRATNFCESLTGDEDLPMLEVRLEKLEIAWKDFSFHHISSLEGLDEQAVFTLEAEFEEYEMKYFGAHTKFTKAIREKQSVDKQINLVEELAQNQSSFLSKLNSSSKSSNVSLPKINIPPFSGNYKDWPTFRDMFIDTVDTNDKLTSTQKFHFLKSFLRNEAADLISHISPTDANYIGAWTKLEKRYNRVNLLVHSLIQSFVSLPTMSSSNPDTLRKITDGADEVIRGLQAAKKETRDPWIIFLLLNKLDEATRHAWAKKVGSRDDCKVQELLDFLELRCDAFESCTPMNTPGTSRKKQPTSIRSHVAESAGQNPKCFKCKGDHKLSECPSFISLSIDSRRKFLKDNSLCFNCLRSGHASYKCFSHFRCRVCKSRHHSLVHSNQSSGPEYSSKGKSSSDFPVDNLNADVTSGVPVASSDSPLLTNHSFNFGFPKQTFLPTILSYVRNHQGELIKCRVLLDTGSQSSFITEALAQRIGLRRKHSRIPILGLSSTNAGHTNGYMSISLASRVSNTVLQCDVHILSKLTSNLPTHSVDSSSWAYIQGLELADPLFNISSSVDILLGADRVWSILKPEQIIGPEGRPLAQNTSFGWVITGEFVFNQISCVGICNAESSVDTDYLLQRFWELEEVSTVRIQTDNDPAELLFRKFVSRSEDGRYIVPLLLKTPSPSFSNTLAAAMSRLNSMERRFQKNPDLERQYRKFMEDYLSLGHMESVPDDEAKSSHGRHFYLPHHAVFKPDSSTTKLRVVFDGSVGDSTGQSINSHLYIGPPIQRDLFGVCLRFRQHRFVFTADIVKMFRQILIRKPETDYQRIVWRNSPSENVKHFRLKTVTYGTSSAPFLAVRVLKQLAEDYQVTHPIAARILLNDVYVDDIMTGANSIEDLMRIQSELVELLSLAKIQLSKWSSNCWSLLAKIPSEDCEYSSLDYEKSSSFIKVLGMYWNPSNDVFSFRFNQPKLNQSLTRRTLLSEVARIYDPLGFLAPSVIIFKIMFQELWSSELKLGWDDPLPQRITTQWMNHRDELPLFRDIRVRRNIFSEKDIELHGFSDASTLAYAAVVYARSRTVSGEVKVTIIAAKTKVAPLKPLSIPRLELCGALLLSKLLKLIKSSLNVHKSIRICAWCDSEIVLHWLNSPPRRWTTFVANRTSTILETVPSHSWRHIASQSNPADCASRGVSPSELVNHSLWWSGPSWLSESEERWPIHSKRCTYNEVAKKDPVQLEARPLPTNIFVSWFYASVIQDIIDNISSWHRLIRVLAYIRRYISNLRVKSTGVRVSGGLKFHEIHSAKMSVLKHVQLTSYPREIDDLLKTKTLSPKSNLLKYSAFLDSDGLLRVGGRIKHAAVSYNIKHPIILPKTNKISFLIVEDIHNRYMHAGVSETFTFVRQQFWIMGSRNIVRKVIHRCKPCFMQRKATCEQLMGNLPLQRIQPNRAFTDTGCDYAGPLTIKLNRGRKPKLLKAYIALFICFSTKAIHLEVVSDLTTDAFLAALRRFVSRRGLCRNIYSDNGTNFQGAKRCLSEMHQLVLSQKHNDTVISSLAKDGIAWHFIPPSAPHFGGLWESGIRSVKLHLRRVIGSTILTFEELTTVTCQIEAILNSRPLCCLSDVDLNPLTPSHFLIGEPTTAVPEPSQLETPTNRLTHWNFLQNMVQGFWKRWQQEYLTSLQERPKWQKQLPNLKPGDIVVIKEPNLPPTKWLLGQIENVSPGADQLVRVATIRTSTGTFTRPIAKLAILPLS